MAYSEQQHAEAKTRWFSDERKANRFDSMPMWKGDHRGCKHHTGECIAGDGWQLANDGTIRPIVIPMNVEGGAMAMIEYPGQKGRFPEPHFAAKGWVKGEEATGLRPSAEIARVLLQRGEEEVAKTMEHRGAKVAEVAEAVSEFRAKYRGADTTSSETEKRGPGRPRTQTGA